jgi:enamine deaminase RidA (YjgF/YER057c/UK114 family)
MVNYPTYLQPAGVATPLGPYSHLSRVGELVFVAGQIGLDTKGTLVGPDLHSQAKQTFANIRVILESQGGSLRSVLKFTTYLVGADRVEDFHAVRKEIFPELFPEGEYPPNTLLVVDRLVRPGLLVEIETVAHVSSLSPS